MVRREAREAEMERYFGCVVPVVDKAGREVIKFKA
jgi:hypothetical protein